MTVPSRTLMIMAGGTGGHIFASGRAYCLQQHALNQRQALVSLRRKCALADLREVDGYA